MTKEIMVLKNRDLKNNEGSRLDLRSPGLRTGKGLGAEEGVLLFLRPEFKSQHLKWAAHNLL